VAIDLTHVKGQTQLDPDELGGLKPKHLTNQAQLNEWEQANIAKGEVWAHKQRARMKTAELLDMKFVRAVHTHMFNQTWTWAGTFRTTDKTIGVDAQQVATRLHQLMGNAAYWVDQQVFPADEMALRFHHNLVWIHPFPNGNGRHSRLMADLVIMSLGAQRFSWGSNANLVESGGAREAYIAALQAADAGNFAPLLAFART
jgi:Fic-DOC domain mobile mystery protein B